MAAHLAPGRRMRRGCIKAADDALDDTRARRDVKNGRPFDRGGAFGTESLCVCVQVCRGETTRSGVLFTQCAFCDLYEHVRICGQDDVLASSSCSEGRRAAR